MINILRRKIIKNKNYKKNIIKHHNNNNSNNNQKGGLDLEKKRSRKKKKIIKNNKVLKKIKKKEIEVIVVVRAILMNLPAHKVVFLIVLKVVQFKVGVARSIRKKIDLIDNAFIFLNKFRF